MTALALGMAVPSASAATEYTGPVCNGRYQQVSVIGGLYTYNNWKATYRPGKTTWTYDRYFRSTVDFPSSGIGYLLGRYSCTISGPTPV